MNNIKYTAKKLFNFYYEGFKKMTLGKTLWIIILFKLFIIFAILKLFFFPDFLKTNYKSDKEIKNHVFEHLTQTKNIK